MEGWKCNGFYVDFKIIEHLNKQFYLYDTFDGMSEPTEFDKDYSEINAKNYLKIIKKIKQTKSGAIHLWKM